MIGGPAVVLSCEHASAAVPEGVELGVQEALLRSHAGWDPGALEIAQALARRLDAPLHAGSYTRLFVDLNRSGDSEAALPLRSFGVDVPGNAALDAWARRRRLEAYHRPYREAVRREVEQAVAAGGRCLHLSVHSFTPELDGRPRPFDVGILYDPARRWEAALAAALLEGLRREGLEARANEPYPGTDDGMTTWLRTLLADPLYAGIEVEASQALTTRPGGLERISEALGRLVPGVLRQAGPPRPQAGPAAWPSGSAPLMVSPAT